jgi:hypothetical protein
MPIINKMASISWSISKHEQLHLFFPMRVHFIHLRATETRFIEASIISDSFYGLQKNTILAYLKFYKSVKSIKY